MKADEIRGKINIDLVLSVSFFSVSNFSRMLSLIGIPRTVPYFLLIVIFAVFCLNHIKDLRIFDLAFFLTVIPFTLLGLAQYSSYIDSSSRVFAILILFIPSYYFFRLCEKSSFEKGFKISVYFSVLYLLAFYLFVVSKSGTYDMNYAYWIAVPMCALFYYYMKERKLIQIVLFGCSMLSLVISGCRGALVLSVLCIAYYYLFCDFGLKDKKRKKVRVIFVCTLLILVLINVDTLAALLAKYVGSSRTIDKLLSGDFLVSQSRDRLYAICKDLISNKPFGYGVLASRELISEYPYPHSIFYELQLDYGMIIGSIMTFAVVAITGKLLFDYRKDSSAVYIAIIAFVGIGSLFVSSSLYYEYYVPAIIALAVKSHYKKKEKISENKRCISQISEAVN